MNLTLKRKNETKILTKWFIDLRSSDLFRKIKLINFYIGNKTLSLCLFTTAYFRKEKLNNWKAIVRENQNVFKYLHPFLLEDAYKVKIKQLYKCWFVVLNRIFQSLDLTESDN